MTHSATPPYKALRESIGMSQRAVERALGWKRGRLSVIERGLIPTPEEAGELRAYYAGRMLDTMIEVTKDRWELRTAEVEDAEEHDPGAPWNAGGHSN